MALRGQESGSGPSAQSASSPAHWKVSTPRCHPNTPRFWSRHPHRCPDLSQVSPNCLACLEHPHSCPKLFSLYPLPSVSFHLFQLVLSWVFLGVMAVFLPNIPAPVPAIPGSYQSHLSSPKHLHVCLGPSYPKHACFSLSAAVPRPTTGYPRHPASASATPSLGNPTLFHSELGTLTSWCLLSHMYPHFFWPLLGHPLSVLMCPRCPHLFLPILFWVS